MAHTEMSSEGQQPDSEREMHARTLLIASAFGALMALGFPWIQRTYVDDSPPQDSSGNTVSVWGHEDWNGWHLWDPSGLDSWAPTGQLLCLAVGTLTVVLLVASLTRPRWVSPGAALAISLVLAVTLIVLSMVVQNVGTSGEHDASQGRYGPRVAGKLWGLGVYQVAIVTHLAAAVWAAVIHEHGRAVARLKHSADYDGTVGA